MSGTLRPGQKVGTWELRVSLGSDPLTGKYRQLSRTFKGSRRDAQKALAELVTQVANDGHQLGGNDATVADLLAQWLDLVNDRLSPLTMRNYRAYSRRYLVDGIGRKQVRKVTARDLDKLYQALSRERGLSPRTVRQAHAILRGAFAQAVRWGWVRTNPAASASPPKVHKTDVHPPSPEVAVKLIRAAEEMEPAFGLYLRLAAATGARRGELCALRWSDVDLANATLVVARNLIEPEGGGWIEKDTKTHQARRVSLDPVTVGALRASRHPDVRDNGFVFSTDATGAEPWLPHHQTHRFEKLCRQQGVKGVRLHDLRHMHATQLLGANIDVRTVAGRLGHANAATTLGVYAQFLETRDRDAAGAIGLLLDGDGSDVRS